MSISEGASFPLSPSPPFPLSLSQAAGIRPGEKMHEEFLGVLNNAYSTGLAEAQRNGELVARLR